MGMISFFVLVVGVECLDVTGGAGMKGIKVERAAAKTIVRLWHDLHVEKGVEHDFQRMLAPNEGGFFVGGDVAGDIRAIACCNRVGVAKARVERMAYAPYHAYVGSWLLHHLIIEEKMDVEWDSMRQQDAFFLEAMLASQRDFRFQ